MRAACSSPAKGRLRDPGPLSQGLDYRVAVVIGKDTFDIDRNVVRTNRKSTRALPHRPVRLCGNLQQLHTIDPRALAGDSERADDLAERLVEFEHLLVDRTEQRLVAGTANLAFLIRS